MPYEIDLDALKTEMTYIAGFVQEQPVPEDLAALAMAEGADTVDELFKVWLAAGVISGIFARIIERIDRFIIPV